MADDLKLANVEAHALIKLHTSTLFQWAQAATPAPIMPDVKKALIASVARLYEVVEGLPEIRTKTRLH